MKSQEHWNMTAVTGGICGFLTYGELALLGCGMLGIFLVGFACGRWL